MSSSSTSSSPLDIDIDLWVSVLEGSFDAGLLIDESTGIILHANETALDLFGAPSKDLFLKSFAMNEDAPGPMTPTTIEHLMSFWSYSLTSNLTDESERPTTMEATDDTLSWSQVMQYAAGGRRGSIGSAGGMVEVVKPVEEWTITCNKMQRAHSPTKASLAGAAAGEAPNENNQNNTSGSGMRRVPSNPSLTSGNNHETFPAVLKVTRLGPNYNHHRNLWLAFVRHADYHDIVMTGSVTNGSNSRSQVKRSSRRSSASKNKEKRLTMDENGTIVDISDAALQDAKQKDSTFAWLTTDLIGKHISQTPMFGDNATGGADIPRQPFTIPPQSFSHSNNNKAKPFRMLDLILESGMEPGHSACPMSGFPLRIESNVSAMTTGGAQREENITEAAFEAALDPIFQIDEHGTIQMVNSAASTTFGWRRSEFLGENISMICGGGHQAKHAGYISRYLATGDTRVIGKNRELIAQRKDGTEFPIELGVVEVDTFAGDVRLFCGFVRDLTHIKARERLAQEMVEAALDPMFHINATGKILMVNKAAVTTFGYEREELMGKNVSIICGGSHGMNHDLYIKKYIRTGETRVIGKYRELPAKRKDGSEFPIQLAVVEIQVGGRDEDRMFVGFVHDLSRQKRDQDIMKGTIDTSLDPVLHINENGIIQLVNNAVIDHLGWTREELVGENVSMIVGGEHAQHHGKYIERYLETGEKRAMGKKRKLMARRKDGTEMPIELGLSEITLSGGKERLFCAFLTDLSSRHVDLEKHDE